MFCFIFFQCFKAFEFFWLCFILGLRNRTFEYVLHCFLYSSKTISKYCFSLLGSLVGEMLKNMKNISETPDSQQKMFLYSAVSITSSIVLDTSGLYM